MSEDTIIAVITPKMLEYYRKKARMSLIQASTGIITAHRLHAAEKGKEKLLLSEARRLAEKYKISLAAFYLHRPPTLHQRLQWKTRHICLKITKYLCHKYDFDEKDLQI